MCIAGCTPQKPSQTPNVVGGTENTCPVDKHAFVVVCGGPGNYNSGDPRHDKAWDNYITTAAQRHIDGRLKALDDECLYMLVYKEAYERRWVDDNATGKNDHRWEHVRSVRDAGLGSYVELIEKKAKERKRNLVWFSSPNDLFPLLRGITRKISRVWYFGHANQHFLFLRWERGGTEAVKVATTEIEQNSDLLGKMIQNDDHRLHKFYGCNTANPPSPKLSWAETWAKTFHVYTVGANETIDFVGGGTVNLTTAGGKWRSYSSDGIEKDLLTSGVGVDLK